MTVAKWSIARLVLGALGAVLLTILPAVGVSAAQDTGAAIQATEEATRLIQDDRLPDALEALERALEADDEYWEAHYQRGRVLGLMGRWQESLDAMARATELNPGHGHSHRLAFIAASNVQDWPTAWDQAIKAQLAGEDMRQSLLDMYDRSPPPDDFATRINAATVFVGDMDVSTALADSELPTNFNPQTGMGARQGRPAQMEDSALNQSTFDLQRLQRDMRFALSESPGLAVVLDPGRAQYILAISITEISLTEPRAVEGYFRFIDIAKQEVVYRSPMAFSDISATTVIAGKLRRYVVDLSAWLEKRDARQE